MVLLTPGPAKEKPAEVVAVVADIHGNAWALEAVLEDITRRGIRTIYNLGDSVYGPLDPGRTAALLMEAEIPSLVGNQDRILLEPLPAEPHPTLEFTVGQLSRLQFKWLREQPCTIETGELFLCHGTPDSDETYLLEAVTESGVALRSVEELEELTEGIEHPLILCGHTHIPRVVALGGKRLIVNPGSVGLPAYTDDLPVPHRMETGSPHARYAALSHNGKGWQVDLVAVPYDTRPAVEAARRNRRPDWAHAIETGFAL